MKKYYYFSEKSLEFVEIKRFKAKFSIYLALVAVVFISLTFFSFYFFAKVSKSGNSYSYLQNENKVLKAKLVELSDQYKEIQNDLEGLEEKTDNLRIAANLHPLSEDEKLLGVGGGSFHNTFDFLSTSNDLDFKNAFETIDKISKQFKFEKSQYTEISKKMKTNEDLFESIPAIMPTKGEYESSQFGMRIHPILKIRKMHYGIDFVTNIGTPVYAPGKGRVVFVGRRGGYGLEVEIDHGYGYRTRYAHLSKSLVKRGQRINRGDLIAKTGNSGLATGPHLHYEVSHNGVKLNPSKFFFDDLGFVELTNKN